jgi:hypothetical protein
VRDASGANTSHRTPETGTKHERYQWKMYASLWYIYVCSDAWETRGAGGGLAWHWYALRHQQFNYAQRSIISIVPIRALGKVTLKGNGDEALSDEFLLKSNDDEAFNTQKKL